LDGQYTIPLKVIAMAKTIVRKKQIKRGVMCLPEDFRKQKNYVTDDSLRASVQPIKRPKKKKAPV